MLRLADHGCQVWSGALAPRLVNDLCAQVSEVYARVARLHDSHGPWGVDERLDGVHYLPTAASFELSALPGHGDLLGGLDAGLRHLVQGQLSGAQCDLNLCWVRRQMPERDRPEAHAPHSWHQDGVCGHDFMGGRDEDALVAMVTVWIALSECGRHAPGVELITSSPPALCPPLMLNDAALEPRFGPDSRHTPELSPGDALVMLGHVLHRTHVTESMAAERRCVELRFVCSSPTPERFRSHRLIPLPA